VTTEVAGATGDRAQAEEAFREEGCSAPRAWGNAPGDRYGAHSHEYHKVLFCLDGSITFHLPEGDLELSRGGRLDLPAGTEHSATVGPEGVECIEASR